MKLFEAPARKGWPSSSARWPSSRARARRRRRRRQQQQQQQQQLHLQLMKPCETPKFGLTNFVKSGWTDLYICLVQGWLRAEHARRAEPRAGLERAEHKILLTNTLSSEPSGGFRSKLEHEQAQCSRLRVEQRSLLGSKFRAKALLVLGSLGSL